ncbi:hypothetical protein Tco_0734063 [Tanacetum coccineum]
MLFIIFTIIFFIFLLLLWLPPKPHPLTPLRKSNSPSFHLENSVYLRSEDDDTTTPSLVTKSSSPSPPNAPSKTSSTKDRSSTFGTTTSSFKSKPQSSPLSSNDTPSPQPSDPFLNDIMDAPPKPSNPLPL